MRFVVVVVVVAYNNEIYVFHNILELVCHEIVNYDKLSREVVHFIQGFK